jgi:putative spermidine/putrescine transport system permease protein
MNRFLLAITKIGIPYFLCSLILLPLVIVLLVSFTKTTYITFPPKGLTLDWFMVALHNNQLMRALIVSLKVGGSTAVLATMLGTIAGLHISRSMRWYVRPITALFLGPLTVPIIVLSIGLLFYLSSLGFVRTLLGLVIGHTVITIPYSIRIVSASVGRLVDQWERTAAICGADPWQVFWAITMPSIRAGIIASLIFTFIISFNNVTIALFVAGARTQTLPLVMLQMTKEQVSPELAALSSLLVVFTFLFMATLEVKFGIYKVFEKRREI